MELLALKKEPNKTKQNERERERERASNAHTKQLSPTQRSSARLIMCIEHILVIQRNDFRIESALNLTVHLCAHETNN